MMNRELFGAAICALLTLGGLPQIAFAQGDGARMYWKSLTDANAITFMPMHMTGNSNPLDPAHVVVPNADFELNMALVGYTRTLDLFGRSAMVSALMPVGEMQADVSGLVVGQSESASGFGDLTLQLNLNLYGAPAMNDLQTLQRYEPKFTIDVIADLGIPVGEYNSDDLLNMGQNRWYGRIGFPMMLTLGPWVPGERTTIELLPAVWLFGDNTDYLGQTLSTDPLFQLEGHLTRDLTTSMWASLDAAWFSGAESDINGIPGESLDNLGIGFTFGYQINDNLLLTAGYFTTINDDDPGDLQGDVFRINLTYGWHALVEGMKRMSEGH
jgi:hypothetical protein